jgi:hypothetical protein
MPSFIEENGLPHLVASGFIPGTLSSRFYGLETNKKKYDHIYIYIYIYILKSSRFLEIYCMRNNDNVMLLTTISAGAYDFLA